MPNINISLSEEEHELLRKLKSDLTWKQLLMRVAKDKAWRIEEAEYYLNKIIAIFPETKNEVEALRKKIKKQVTRDEETVSGSISF